MSTTIWDDYPFPLESGGQGWLRLPRGEFTEMDAKRLGAIAAVLVIETTQGQEPAAYLEDQDVQEQIDAALRRPRP